MKRTVIHYKKLRDGNVKIVDVENLCGEEELKKVLSASVLQEYVCSNERHYRDWRSIEYTYVVFLGGGFAKHIGFSVGDVMRKERFSELITAMKAAGDRLKKIKEKHEKVYQVVI